jgi:hypothetical protein
MNMKIQALVSRRSAIAGALCVLALPACSTVGDFAGPELATSIRRLMTVSSQRAFARLLTNEGFFADDLARVNLPDELGRSGAIAAALLRTNAVQQQLLRLMNSAAAEAAESAAPVIYDRIRTMSITDALALARGGPTAATQYLQRQLGTAIVDAMFPGVGRALRVIDSGLVDRVAQAATGLSFAGLQRHVAEEAAEGIYSAIGREEARIRADPSAIDDPLLRRLFGGRG